MARVREELGSGRGLDDPPQVHHGHAVADVAHDGHVVGDQQDRQPEPGPQVLEQVEHRRLHRHVERGDRLVGDEQVGLERERPRDADPLPLPAGELPGVGIQRAGAEPHQLEQLAAAGVDPIRRNHLVKDQELAERLPYRHPGVERRVGILKDDLDAAP